MLAAGRILFEANAPSVSSVSQDEQQETLEGFRNEVGLLSLGCPQCRAGDLPCGHAWQCAMLLWCVPVLHRVCCSRLCRAAVQILVSTGDTLCSGQRVSQDWSACMGPRKALILTAEWCIGASSSCKHSALSSGYGSRSCSWATSCAGPMLCHRVAVSSRVTTQQEQLGTPSPSSQQLAAVLPAAVTRDTKSS